MTTTATLLTLDSDPAMDADLESRLHLMCRDAGFDEAVAGQFTTAIIEAVNNSKEHGYQGEPGHPITVQWVCSDDCVQVEIRDRGPPLPADILERRVMPSPYDEHGRGWAIIQKWTDLARYHRDGDENALNLTRRR